MVDATAEMIGWVVRTVEYNTGHGGSEAISAAQIRLHLCANSTYPIEAVNQAIATALECGISSNRARNMPPRARILTESTFKNIRGTIEISLKSPVPVFKHR